MDCIIWHLPWKATILLPFALAQSPWHSKVQVLKSLPLIHKTSHSFRGHAKQHYPNMRFNLNTNLEHFQITAYPLVHIIMLNYNIRYKSFSQSRIHEFPPKKETFNRKSQKLLVVRTFKRKPSRTQQRHKLFAILSSHLSVRHDRSLCRFTQP
jgi:hypothetical protein